MPGAGATVTESSTRVREKAHEERQKKLSGRDLTKFNVTIDRDTETHLPKRRAIFRIVKHLCEHGISPEEISKILPRSHERLWRQATGELDSEEFVQSVARARQADGLAFEAGRWWIDDGELITSAGSTYAFTKMWGENTEDATKALLSAFPAIRYLGAPQRRRRRRRVATTIRRRRALALIPRIQASNRSASCRP